MYVCMYELDLNETVFFRAGVCYFEQTLQCIQSIFNSWQVPVKKLKINIR